jgi:hypothetical protein
MLAPETTLRYVSLDAPERKRPGDRRAASTKLALERWKKCAHAETTEADV